MTRTAAATSAPEGPAAMQLLLTEFDTEMAATRRLLERVPGDRATWKPHDRSFPLGHLALLVAWMPGWIANTLTRDSLDLATWPQYTFETTESILATFDANVRAAHDAIAAIRDGDLERPWSLMRGGRVLFTAPRGPMVRNHLSHLIHHRGQLTVYLRLLDVPLPQLYGPTADDRS